MKLRHNRLKLLYIVNKKIMKTAENKLFDICTVYQKVKPAMKFITALLFWKPKWKSAIQELIKNLDEVCN